MVRTIPMFRSTLALPSETLGVRRRILLPFFFVCPAELLFFSALPGAVSAVSSVSAVMIVDCVPRPDLRLRSESLAKSTMSPTGQAKANRRAMTTQDHTSFLSGLFGCLGLLLSAMVYSLLRSALDILIRYILLFFRPCVKESRPFFAKKQATPKGRLSYPFFTYLCVCRSSPGRPRRSPGSAGSCPGPCNTCFSAPCHS